MAVENKYVNADIVAGDLASALGNHGAEVFVLVANFEVAAADDDGSKYRLAKGLSPDITPLFIIIENDAITGGTGYDLGLYETDGGAAIDDDVFMAAQTMATGRLGLANGLDGLVTVDLANRQKKLYEHAGHTILTKKASYDLVLTADTVGTAAGTIRVTMIFSQGHG